MGRKAKPPGERRKILNLTIHPDVRAWADELSSKRRRSISLLFEDLVEAEWHRQQAAAHHAHFAPPSFPAPAWNPQAQQ